MEHGVISMEQGVDRYKIVFLSKITYIEKCLDVVATLQAKKDSDEKCFFLLQHCTIWILSTIILFQGKAFTCEFKYYGQRAQFHNYFHAL
ncbi:unnamed protein product [Lactuca virosa]|uniref:Uncharacterized protein n=1 Tax=Lactuca virosa TaxID=75947 RepID=A0AAU9N7R4_9ASTR|nr:unnamed protein product [Lactuca virosa]